MDFDGLVFYQYLPENGKSIKYYCKQIYIHTYIYCKKNKRIFLCVACFISKPSNLSKKYILRSQWKYNTFIINIHSLKNTYNIISYF